MVPIITVDGPSGVGKGTLSLRLAQLLQWNFLDSGAIYRAFALYAEHQGVSLEDEGQLFKIAATFPLRFEINIHLNKLDIFLGNDEVTANVRLETTGNKASIVAKYPLVREALLAKQRDFAKVPGLVADGRDMGTVVFPEADLKIFLIASSEVRAERRYQELLNQKNCVKIEQILLEIKERDERDKNRSVSPLKPAHDAVVIDTSRLSIDEVFQEVYQCVLQKKFLI